MCLDRPSSKLGNNDRPPNHGLQLLRQDPAGTAGNSIQNVQRRNVQTARNACAVVFSALGAQRRPRVSLQSLRAVVDARGSEDGC